MKDLTINYINENNEEQTMEFDTIMDFADGVESGEIDVTTPVRGDVEATFFGNRHTTKNFPSLEELYDHCVEIMR